MPIMTGGDFNGVQCTLLKTEGGRVNSEFTQGRMRVFVDRYDMSTGTVAKSKTLALGYMPKEAVTVGGYLTVSATLGSSEVSVGITGTVAKYRASAVKTTVTPELIGVATLGLQLSAAEEILIVNNTAADLPTSGTVALAMFYAIE